MVTDSPERASVCVPTAILTDVSVPLDGAISASRKQSCVPFGVSVFVAELAADVTLTDRGTISCQ